MRICRRRVRSYFFTFLLWLSLLLLYFVLQHSTGIDSNVVPSLIQTSANPRSVAASVTKLVSSRAAEERNSTTTSALPEIPWRQCSVEEVSNTSLASCSLQDVPRGPRKPLLASLSWEALSARHHYVHAGGLVRPCRCRPIQTVAVVVSYRDREQQLKVFLNNMLPLLRKQRLQAWIVVVEQMSPRVFNKGVLYNTGFLTALKLQPKPSCFIFHDVDLIPEDDRLDYWCRDRPVHLSEAHSVGHYKKAYAGHFGGVVLLTKDMFLKANGYPTVYWGWGGEDDEMSYRVGRNVWRPPVQIGRYTMQSHNWTVGWGEINQKKLFWFYSKHLRKSRDGVRHTTLPAINIRSTVARPLYTHVQVDINEDVIWRLVRYDKLSGTLAGFVYRPKPKR